jgi:hypothetical protein
MSKQTICYNHWFDLDLDIVYFELQSGDFYMVSISKWDMVSKYKWYCSKAGYAFSYDLGKMPLHRYVYMLHLGHKLPSDFYIDHIDRNRLNNTDNNLRMVSPQQNSWNRSVAVGKKYKGVIKCKNDKWAAVISKDGKQHRINDIASQDDAAKIYNLMAQEMFGEYAALNNISEVE